MGFNNKHNCQTSSGVMHEVASSVKWMVEYDAPVSVSSEGGLGSSTTVTGRVIGLIRDFLSYRRGRPYEHQ